MDMYNRGWEKIARNKYNLMELEKRTAQLV